MQIKDVILTPGHGAFFYDDQAAIRAGAGQDGFIYVGDPVTPGFQSIRVPASCLSIGLVLADDTIAPGAVLQSGQAVHYSS